MIANQFDDIARAAYQQSQAGQGPSIGGMVGNFIGQTILWTSMENAAKMNAVGLGRDTITGRLLNWISKGRVSLDPLESVTSRMQGWLYMKKPGFGIFGPNKDMRAVSRATYSALGDLLKGSGSKGLFSGEGLRLLVGSTASIIGTLTTASFVVQMGAGAVELGKGITDQFAKLGRKFIFAPWDMSMSDTSLIPQSQQYRALHSQAVSQLMQSRQMIAQHTSENQQRMLYNNPYDFYNFV
jgi:hypothetical protein